MRPTQKKKEREKRSREGRRGKKTKGRAVLESMERKILRFGPKQWEGGKTIMEIGLVTYSSTQSQ